MTNQKTYFRIHPTIGMARVGNSDDYYLGPETMAAEPIEGQKLTGGLPIKKGTESTPISSSDLRDSDGKLKRQAARFKIYMYQNEGSQYSYPSPASTEVTIGSKINGKTVTEIRWMVHLANKKANCWEIDEDANEGILLYENNQTPPIRNPEFFSSADPADKVRLQKLIIDAGPRAVAAKAGSAPVEQFEKSTSANYMDDCGNIQPLPNYPISFPASDGAPGDYNASSEKITYLGEITSDEKGRLLVLGGHGKACGFDNNGNPDPNAKLGMDVDNNNWLDDTSDGPVNAALVFDDGSIEVLESTAWAVITDPSYAPQTLNVVTTWDDIYNTWVEKLGIAPNLFSNGQYNQNYQPSFHDDVFPIFNAAHMQIWNTNLNKTAIQGHQKMAMLGDAPRGGFKVTSYIRNPNPAEGEIQTGAPLMPLSLGDSAMSFLTVSTTQFFFLNQWDAGKCAGTKPINFTAGERLDRNILMNCLGGRYSPGIDLTFIVRDEHLYNSDWKNPAIGAFRINGAKMDYPSYTKNAPALGVGYTPLRSDPVEPGDICKFMAIPWHTDYNSCATHIPAPNPGGDLTNGNLFSGVNATLYWSWPAQRPVAVYNYEDIKNNGGSLFQNDNMNKSLQRYSVRGKGTNVQNGDSPGGPTAPYQGAAMQVGRYQERVDMLLNWHRIGFVIQGPAIDGYPADMDDNYFLEVESQFDEDESNLVVAWPNQAYDKVYPPKNEGEA